MFDSSSPESFALPADLPSRLSTFQRILILRGLRSDKVTNAVQGLVSSELGPAFIEPPPFDLLRCYQVCSYYSSRLLSPPLSSSHLLSPPLTSSSSRFPWTFSLFIARSPLSSLLILFPILLRVPPHLPHIPPQPSYLSSLFILVSHTPAGVNCQNSAHLCLLSRVQLLSTSLLLIPDSPPAPTQQPTSTSLPTPCTPILLRPLLPDIAPACLPPLLSSPFRADLPSGRQLFYPPPPPPTFHFPSPSLLLLLPPPRLLPSPLPCILLRSPELSSLTSALQEHDQEAGLDLPGTGPGADSRESHQDRTGLWRMGLLAELPPGRFLDAAAGEDS
eukprot:767373-Hanusia_phi.AAC.2